MIYKTKPARPGEGADLAGSEGEEEARINLLSTTINNGCQEEGL